MARATGDGSSLLTHKGKAKAISSDTKGRQRQSGTDHGDRQSERAYVTSDQYFLVRSSLKSSSNVPPEARTRENTVVAGLGLIPCLIPFFLKSVHFPDELQNPAHMKAVLQRAMVQCSKGLKNQFEISWTREQDFEVRLDSVRIFYKIGLRQRIIFSGFSITGNSNFFEKMFGKYFRIWKI